MRSFNEALLQVDVRHLKTEHDFDRVAETYLPVVLQQVGEEIAADVWDRCSATITDKHAPFSKVEKRDDYIRSAGMEFARKFSAKTRSAYREMIVDQLRLRLLRSQTTL